MDKKLEQRRSVGARRSTASAQAILEAAEAILREEGYQGFSVEAVARRARAGKPTIYRWWPSKAALLLDVYQGQKLSVEYPQTNSLEDDVYNLLRTLLRIWSTTASGEMFRSIIAEAQTDPSAAEALAAYAAERRLWTGEIVTRAIRRGEVSADVDPELVADMIAGYAWIQLLTGRLDQDEATTRNAARYLARGVVKTGNP
jgi:AcrR family transcriptional regulator